MNFNNQNHQTEMEESASLWAARLDGTNLTNAAQAELEQWLDLNPRHRELLSVYCQFSTDLEEKLPVLLATGGVELPESPASRPGRRWQPWLVSGGLMAAAAIVFMIWILQPATQYESLATPVAQRQSIELVDGSMVDLDARTSLRVEIDATKRRVKLAEGEAFFAVAKDPERPFVVETPAGSVRVKGTKFDVHTISNHDLVVTVLEGVVQISPATTNSAARQITMGVGDQLTISATGSSMRRLDESDLEDAIAWREGRVVFNGVTLQDALDRFGRHHGIGLTATPEAARQKIGGRYALDDLTGFLTALEDAVPGLQVSYNLNGTVLVTLRDSNATNVAGN
ncbi:MAG: FecR domain-containing protein [Cephaloticoccus sp.]|nr:FecR domain-containing protein [Cephaloticoccus sp.]MCF7759601.1 FecR domain-containing protein [Cephaloticoccus sp.]